MMVKIKYLIFLLLVSISFGQDLSNQKKYFATMQVLDYSTTMYALDQGYTEINPIMQPVVQDQVLFAMVKIGIYYIGTSLDQETLKYLNMIYTIIIINNIYQLTNNKGTI